MTVSNVDVPTELVAGKYRLVRLLGRGGMGSVWEGIHTSLGTRVAVKFIEPEYADSVEARNRFENEARAAATLRSKHVVQVYDHGVTPQGSPFIVMEFLSGEPLDKRLDRLGRLPVQDTCRMVHQVCRALSKAHEAGIVHRDLKPENVFLVWDEDDGTDIAKVVDFGIAKFTDKSMGVSSSTRTGSVLGTPFYMSPEQARGLRSVDYRSDLWSVAVIAFRCLIGRLPFEGEAIGDLLVKICTAPLPVPSQWAPGVPPGFDAWFTRALSREPADRFSSASELAEALSHACGIPSSRGFSHASAGSGRTQAVASGPGQPASQAWGHPAAMTPQPSYPHSGPNPAALTGGAFTQTPVDGVPTSSRAPLVAGLVGALLLLGIGAIVAVKVLAAPAANPEPESTASVAADQPAAPATAPPGSAQPVPEVVPALPPSAAVSAAAAAPTDSAKPVAATPRPTTRPRPSSGASTKPKPEVKKPEVKPKPEATKPAPKPSNIDVGY